MLLAFTLTSFIVANYIFRLLTGRYVQHLEELYMNTHGHVSFSWEEATFIVYVEEAFNEEGVAYYIPLIQEAILNRKSREWKRLEIWNNEVLGSPETLAAAKLLYDWYEDNGCYLTAVVTCNSLQTEIVKNIFKSKAEVFTEISKARKWIEGV